MSNNIVIRGGSIVVIDEEGNSFEMNSGGIVEDFTSLAESGSGQKQELTGSFITGIGSQAIYVATESIACGQPLAIFNDGQGNIFAKLATTSSTSNDFLGIALNTASRGDNVTILTQGTTTVAFETSSGGGGPTSTIKLDNNTTGGSTTFNKNGHILFTDSGGPAGNYGSGQDYNYEFDAGDGYTVLLSFDSMSFEHSTSRMYDRLGFTLSTDGDTFNNADISWLQKSNTSTAPWDSRFYEQEDWNSIGSSPGPILPKDVARANSMPKGGYSGSNFFLDTGVRYVKFHFESDSSVTQPGWQIQVKTSNASSEATVGAPIYIAKDLIGLSETNYSSTTASMGTVSAPNSNSSSIYANIIF